MVFEQKNSILPNKKRMDFTVVYALRGGRGQTRSFNSVLHKSIVISFPSTFSPNVGLAICFRMS